MKATEAKLLDLVKKAPQFVIPIYQRTYSWSEKQCAQLWDDILRAGSSDEIHVHFVGSVVYVEQGLSQATHQSPLLVIDGQQRLTTIMLLLEALARAVGDSEPVPGFSASKIRHYYLTNPLEEGDRFYKLILSQTDAESLKAIVRGEDVPEDPSLRVEENFAFFVEMLSSADLAVVCRGISKLVLVDMSLARDQDNPQLIFESMNSTGKALSQADLIRNLVLMGLEPSEQERLYRSYWRPMEREFGQQAYGDMFDSFMRHYLTVRTGDIPREGEVYEAFKAYARSGSVSEAGVEALLSDVRRFARFFCAMALGRETDARLSAVFEDLREVGNAVAYPLLLEMYDDYASGVLSADDFAAAARLVESYMFRRAVCQIPANSLNKTFPAFSRKIDKSRYLESMSALFLLLPEQRRFPSDEEFAEAARTRDLYNFRLHRLWLRRLENAGRKEPVNVDEYSIEHILPQNPDLPDAWRAALGPDWEAAQQELLHTAGNLTLTGYNSEYSDHPFARKRDMPGGFKESPLRLNEGVGLLDVWDQAAIRARGERLALKAVSVWPAPEASAEALAAHRPAPEPRQSSYSLEDHPNLTSPRNGELFEAFRQAVLAMHPSVSEEFRKNYVAYKADSNFVDVVPQKRRLVLSLSLPFEALRDPEGVCRDVSNIGRWGNGDVEAPLASMDDLPYVLGLVRQALEFQTSED